MDSTALPKMRRIAMIRIKRARDTWYGREEGRKPDRDAQRMHLGRWNKKGRKYAGMLLLTEKEMSR